MNRFSIGLAGGVVLLGVAVFSLFFLTGGDALWSLSTPATAREKCRGIPDAQAVDTIRQRFLAKSERQRAAPVWRDRDPTRMGVLSISRYPPDAIVVEFGAEAQPKLSAILYADCLVGWSPKDLHEP